MVSIGVGILHVFELKKSKLEEKERKRDG